MPELDGLAATRIIRRRWPGAEGPAIIGLSGYASSETRHECLAAGMNDYLVKPVSLAHFADALTRVRQAAAAPDARAARATAPAPVSQARRRGSRGRVR